jgi:hypothetical protein
MTELKWVDGIIIGMNEPDVSGYAIVNNGIVESYPIPSEFNEIIKETLAKGRAVMEEVKNLNISLELQADRVDELIKKNIDLEELVEKIKEKVLWRTDDIEPPFRALPPDLVIDKIKTLVREHEAKCQLAEYEKVKK